MPRIQWQDLVVPTASLHRLVGSRPQGDDDGIDARGLQMLVRRLLSKLSLAGRYALTISRAERRLEIICAFELSTDAERAAQAVDAAPAPAPAGWASMRTFVLDDPAMARLLRIAGPGKPRQPPAAAAQEE